MTDSTTSPNQGVLHRGKMRFERDFTQLPNAWLRDRRLSRSARGLLAELMTHDAGYDVSIQALASAGPEGKDALRRMVTELEHYGYLSRSKARRKGRFGGVVWTLLDPFGSENAPHPQTLPGMGKNPAHRGGFTGGGKTDGGSTDGGSTASENPTTKEDQFKNNKYSLPSATIERPVDNFRAACGHLLIDDRHCERGCPAPRVQGDTAA